MSLPKKAFSKNPFSVRIDIGKYAAVVWASDDKTDVRVRAMEPPTHEAIEYKRIQDPAECKKTNLELKEISDTIMRHIKKKLNIDAFEQKTDLTELSDIIPFISDPDRSNKDRDENSGTRRLSELIGVRKKFIKGSIMSVDSEENGRGVGTGSGTAGGGNKSKNGKDKKRGATANMKDCAGYVRHGDSLRVAFTPKTGANKFVIRPAGEEDKEEEPIRVTRAEDVHFSAQSGEHM